METPRHKHKTAREAARGRERDGDRDRDREISKKGVNSKTVIIGFVYSSLTPFR
jgi:hypothetical protein